MGARFAILMSGALAGCAASGGGTPDAGPVDATPRWDTGGTDAGPMGGDAGPGVDSGPGTDAGVDAGPGLDAGADSGPGLDAGVDAGTAADAGPGSDAGPTPSIVVDGVVGDPEWAGAESVANTVATDWGVGLNELHRLRAWADGTDLYIAVEGLLESGAENAIVLYIDHTLGGADGVADPADLTDGTGALDNSLSAGITTPAGFRADFAWGTKDLARAASGFDARMGFRDVASDPADFAWIDAAVAPTACSATACEARLPLATLGAGATGTIALFARLTNTGGTDLANQCLPENNPASPGTVTTVVEIVR